MGVQLDECVVDADGGELLREVGDTLYGHTIVLRNVHIRSIDGQLTIEPRGQTAYRTPPMANSGFGVMRK